MRLTTADLAEIPLPAAWVDKAGDMVKATPEWCVAGPDTTQYAWGQLRLLVATDDVVPVLADLTRRLLEEFDACVSESAGATRRLRQILRAGLRLVAGTPDLAVCSTEEVIDSVRHATRDEDLTVDLLSHVPGDVCGGETVALALKQLASNARKHDGCNSVELMVTAGPNFALRWSGHSGQTGVTTSRHPDLRNRWGLGMVRLAADALGASVIPVHRRPDGLSEAVLALLSGNQRLTLPLAGVDDSGTVARATRSWDEETESPPGRTVPDSLMPLVNDALCSRGTITVHGAHCARRGRSLTWLALRPRGTREFARDVLAGLVHEPALAAVDRTTVRLLGCAQVLGLALGTAPDMWLQDQARAMLSSTCAAFGVEPPAVVGDGRSAPSPHLVAFLARESRGGVLQQEAGTWRFLPKQMASPLLEFLATEGVIPIPSVDGSR